MTTLTISIIVVFVLGYALIATESLTKVNKAAIALLMLVGCWTLYMMDHICCQTAFLKCCPHRFCRAGLPARKLSALRWQGVSAVS